MAVVHVSVLCRARSASGHIRVGVHLLSVETASVPCISDTFIPPPTPLAALRLVAPHVLQWGGALRLLCPPPPPLHHREWPLLVAVAPPGLVHHR